jgi:predicted phage terminase large subunit-like protein
VGSLRTYSTIDLDLIERKMQFEAYDSFHAFRRYMNPKMKKGWWQRHAADHLLAWLDDTLAGKRPVIVIQAPPQHGKSKLVIDFLSWMIGRYPHLSYLYASVSKRLSTRANLAIQRTMDSAKYQAVFPRVRLTPRQAPAGSERRTRNQDLLEFLGDGMGSFRNVTVNGSIVGEGLDIGVIDDPIKGREAANSETIRNKTWDWFTDDFLTRFSDTGALIIILTRWHDDDPVGRLLKGDKEGKVKVLRYPALATPDAKLMPDDPRVPGSGAALFPEHKSREFLEERRAKMAVANWTSLYQQDPYILGGNMFKAEWWRYYQVMPRFKYRVIYADTAQKAKEENDYSVFQCWGVTAENTLYLIDQLRGKWESPELRTNARAFWNKHRAVQNGILRAFKVEDKVSGTGLIQELKREGIPMIGIPRGTDKVQRANDAAPSVEAGLVYLPENAPWLSDYLLEFAQFPKGEHDDQVDPTLDAVVDNLSKTAYSLEDLVG